MLALKHISKRFPDGGGVQDISLEIAAGDRLVLLGPSGSGKTTLLRLIAGLESQDSGTTTLDQVPPDKRGIAYVPQKPALYPEQSVSELCYSNAEILKTFELTSLVSRRPHELSGGEKQRVALARAVGGGKKIWLLDEPFASLDPPIREEFRARMHLLADTKRATIILVTHDPVDAWALGRRVGVLGEGRLKQLGTPEELRRSPGHRFVAFCLGSMCFIDGAMSDGRSGLSGRGESAGRMFSSADGSVICPLPESLRTRPSPTSLLTLGLRPDDIQRSSTVDSPDSARLTGWTPVSAEPHGSGWTLMLARGPHRLRAHWPPDTPPLIGESADWQCPANRCVWFDERGDRLDV
jgi:ABC-type sugar transport system ATPase subunit